jgi:hypothetical protein
MKYIPLFLWRGISVLLAGFVLETALFAENGPPEAAGTGKPPPLCTWGLLWAGSWEEAETLHNRGDLRLVFPAPGLSLRAEAIDRRPLDAASDPAFGDFGRGFTNYGGGLYHRATGSRLLYGVLDQWGLPARLRSPWNRALPLAENHRPPAADLKTAVSSTGRPETYLYLGSPRLTLFPQGPEGGITVRGFLSAQTEGDFRPGFTGGLEAKFGKKAEIRLDGFYTGKTLPARKGSAWFSEAPPLPEREFRLSGLGILLDTPMLTLSSDWALSEAFAGGRDLYGNLGLRFARPLPGGRGRWSLSLAADGAGSRYMGPDGSAPGAGFRSGGKFEWHGGRNSLLRAGASLRAPAWGAAFNRSATDFSWRLPGPGPGKNSGGPFRLTRLSLGADRNASEPEKILDTLSLAAGFSLDLRNFGPKSGGGAFLSRPLGLSLSLSLQGLATAEGGLPSPCPVPQYPYRFNSARAGGELSWSPGFFQFRTRLGGEIKKTGEKTWETSFSAAVRFRPGRFSVKISSPDFPGDWNYTISWRMEKK